MSKEGSLFTDFMGDSPLMKVIDYLLTERELDFSISDLARNAGISRATMYRILSSLIKNKIIVPTRAIGRAKLYKLNKENITVKKLIELDDVLILEDLKKRVNDKEKIKVKNKTRKTLKTVIYEG